MEMGSVVGDDQSSSKADDSMASNKVKFLCSHGGKILPRPVDGHLRYVGGETRVVAVSRDTGFADLAKKLGEMFGTNGLLKYQLPTEDLDTLVTIRCDEDLENMMEEQDRYSSRDGIIRLRAFLFPPRPALIVLDSAVADPQAPTSLEQRYVDAVNGVRTVSRLQVESPGGASVGSPFKAHSDYPHLGLDSPHNRGGLTEIECLSPTAPSDPSPTHADSNTRRRNCPANHQPTTTTTTNNSVRKVSSEGRMGAPNGEPLEVSATRFHREYENPMHFDGIHHGVTPNMQRVRSSPNLQQYQYVHSTSPTYRAKRIMKGGGGLVASKVGAPLYNNPNNNNNNNNNLSRPPGSLLRYGAQRVVNPAPQIVYVARPYGNPEQVMKAVHFPDSDGSMSSGEEPVSGGVHHQCLRIINNNDNTDQYHNLSDSVEYR